MTDTKTTTSPSPQDDSNVINTCLNISDFMYYGQYTTFASTALPSALDLEPLMKHLNNSKGLYEEAFITPGTGKNREIVIGYEGTDLYDQKNQDPYQFTGGQVVGDSYIVAGQTADHPSSGFQGAANFATQVLQAARSMGIPKSNVVLTGHSLGAAEAEYASAVTGLSGYTFGTPGIVAPVDAKASKLINFVDYGDPVGNYASDGPDTYGSKTYGYIDPTTYPRIILSNSIEHYGKTQLIGPSSNNYYVNGAVEDYDEGYDTDAGYNFYEALPYHYLTNYTKDLQMEGYNVNLIPIGGSTSASDGADSNFFGLISAANGQSQTAPAAIACFVSGTRLRGPHGGIAVENLKTRDEVITASGERRPVKWIGHRSIDCRRHPHPHEVMPVRIAADALAPGRPDRELLVSPGHAICVDILGEVLIPAALLVNGSTITQAEVDRVTYWHVELESHDVILAEDLPCESYLDVGNRSFFVEAALVASHAVPDGPMGMPARRCRPFIVDGPLLFAARARLSRTACEAGGEARSIEKAA